jgi:hypothetical protein
MLFGRTGRFDLYDQICLGKGGIRVPEDFGFRDVDDRAWKFIVPLLRSCVLHAFKHIEDSREHFIFHFNQASGFLGNVPGFGSNHGNCIPDFHHFQIKEEPGGRAAACPGIFGFIQVVKMDDVDYAGQRFRFACINGFNERMGVRTA